MRSRQPLRTPGRPAKAEPLHAARSALEAPRVLVAVLTAALAPAATAAIEASYALRGAADHFA
ncbi:hypothetical protein [Streptomyces sp. NPDC058671]|uniref:hypothetical protein n=1 Tax=Streptomyces sp. NPDC058671 TaxID=3346590 RepID=UPI0036606178